MLSCFYFILLSAVYVGLSRLKTPGEKDLFSISIVVAARDEEKRIIPCLQSLEKLDYPDDKFEIIFVDDHSSDNTAEVIGSYCTKHQNWKVVSFFNSHIFLFLKLLQVHQGDCLSIAPHHLA